MLTLAGHKGAVRALAYAPGSESLLASAGDDRIVRLWEPATGREIGQLDGCRDGLLSLVFAADGRRLATGGRAGEIAVWDVETRQRDPGVLQPAGPVVALSFTGDGRALLAVARNLRYGPRGGLLFCRDLSPPHRPESLDWRGDVESAAVSPQRDLFAIADQNRGVEFWEVARRQNEPLFRMPGRVRSLCFSPGDGRLLAVAGGREVAIWDVDAKGWRARCHGHRGDVLALAFSPDGLLLLSGGMDRNVRLWETLTGRQLMAWDWKVGIVGALAYSTDGMTAAVAGEKPHVVVWDVDES
jgi:WD40 repeat protein